MVLLRKWLISQKRRLKWAAYVKGGEKGDESSPRLSEEPKGYHQKYFGEGRESPLPIRAFVFTTETEKSLYLSFCQS